MLHSMEAYELLYAEQSVDNLIESVYRQNINKNVVNWRLMTTKAGNQMYISGFPVIVSQEALEKAREQKAKSTEAQQLLNERNSRKQLEIIANANFLPGDILLGCDYDPAKQPKNTKEAQRNINNMIKRMDYLREKKGLSKIRWIKVTERTEGAEGVKFHHHLLVSGDGIIRREDYEELWPFGTCNTKRYQHKPEGIAGYAHYLGMKKTDRKTPQYKATKRSWSCSRNLVRPKPTESNKKLSKKQMAVVAAGVYEDAARIFEKVHPDYILLDYEIRYSRFAPGAYIYVRMRKRVEDYKITIRAKKQKKGRVNTSEARKKRKAAGAVGERGAAMLDQVGGFSKRGLS